jgi:hypothetical protein
MPNNLIDALSGVADIFSANWPPKMPQPPEPPTWELGRPTIDVVVPHRGDELVTVPGFDGPVCGGLVMTVSSCEQVLAGSRYDYKYFIVSNDNPDEGPQKEAFDRAVEYIKNTGHLGKVLYENTLVSPPTARNVGAAAGSGDLIFFFDNHCYVNDGFFDRAVETFETRGADSLHGVTKFLDNQGGRWLHYTLSLEDRFIGNYTNIPPNDDLQPYRIAVSGHGAFAIKRSVWKEVDGYWDGFVGYGGEEYYLDLKLAMMDMSNFLDPRMSHLHQGLRLRDCKRSPDQLSAYVAKYVQNLIASANIIGGTKWAEQTANSFLRNGIKGLLAEEARTKSKPWFNEQLQTAIERSEPRRIWFDAKKQRTLEQQLYKFGYDGVAC